MSVLKLSLVGFVLRVALMLVVMINALLLARLLGPREFGEYFLFLRVVSVLAIVADLGLSQSANAFFGSHREWGAHLHRFILRFVLVFFLGTALLAGLVFYLAGDILLPNYPRLLMLMSFAVLPFSLYANVWNSMMIGMGRIWRVNLVQLVMCTLSLMLTVVVIAGWSGRLEAAAWIYVALMLVQFATMLVMAIRLNAETAMSAPPAELRREILHFGLRGYGASVLSLLWMRIPVFLLNATAGPAAVGVFSVAQHVIEKMLLPVQSLQDAVYQRMSVLSSDLSRLAMNGYLRLTWWGMLVLILLGELFAPFLIVSLLGEAYAGAGQVARILFLGTAFIGISLLLDTYFLNQLRRPGLVSILAWINVLAGLLLALLLIPRWGMIGAAWTLTLTHLVRTVVYLVLYVRISQTRVVEVISLYRRDVILLQEQIGAMLRSRASEE